MELPQLRLVLCPRHVERADEVERLILERGFRCRRRSEMKDQLAPQAAAQASDDDAVVLVDTLGELADLYSICTVAFMGRSLIRLGGSNPLEALAQGKPVLFGPHMFNLRDVSQMALRAGLGWQVNSAEELAQQVVRLCADGPLLRRLEERALAFVEENRGASQRCAAAVLSLLSPSLRSEDR